MKASRPITTSDSRRVLVLGVIFAAAFNFRSVVLAVPPVLPEVRSELHLSYTASGVITALPLLCFAVGSIPGAVLASRFGPRRLVGAALLGLVIGGLVRLLQPETVWIFAGTALLSLSVAAAQPSLPFLIRSWFAGAVQQVLSLYVLAIACGGLVSASSTLYLAQFGGWRGTFAIWSLVALIGAGLWLWLAPDALYRESPPTPLFRLIRNRSLWRVAVLYGAQNFMYFSVISWLPFLLHGFSVHYVEFTLFVLNVIPLPLFIGLAVTPWSYATSARFYVAGGVMATAGVLGLALGLDEWAWALVLPIGFGTAVVAMVGMAAPAVLARSESDVAAYSAVVLTIGQAVGFIGPLLGGLLIDREHSFTAPFWPAIAAGILIVVLSATARSAIGPRLDPVE